MVRRFLVVPLLAPWALVLLVSVLNPRPALSLRLLVWRSPALPIGTWLAVVSSTGAVLSLSASALALQGGRRGAPGGGWAGGARFGAPRRSRRVTEDHDPGQNDAWQQPAPAPAPVSAGPARAPGEPPPTVSVPFRVIRKGSGSTAEASGFPFAGPVASETSASTGSERRPWGMGRRRSQAPPPPFDPGAASGDGWDEPDDDSW